MVKLNRSEFKWLIILIGFTYYIYYLLHTGKIYIFVHPRMVKYIQFSLIVFIILTLFQLKRLFIVTNHKRKISFIIFLIPLILGIYINPQGLNNQIESKKGISMLENGSSANKTTMQTSATKTSQTSNNNGSDVPAMTHDIKNSSKSSTDNTILTIDNGNFIDSIDNLYSDTTNKYKGKKIVITGFVYRDKTITQNQFVIARLVITCCIADAEVTGLLCECNNTDKLKTDDWVKITGTLDTKVRKDNGESISVPIIKINNIEPSAKPQNQYIYANLR